MEVGQGRLVEFDFRAKMIEKDCSGVRVHATTIAGRCSLDTGTLVKSMGAKTRAIGLLAVLATTLVLSGCEAERQYRAGGPKHLRPITSETYKLMAAKGMKASDPILIRVFKKEKELEMWKRDKTGKFALLRTYPICAVGGTIGPKI